MARLLVIGDVVTDVVVHPQGPIASGTDTASQITIGGGGSGANTAAWAASNGANVSFVGRVGADQALWHQQLLEAVGTHTYLSVDPYRPTSRIVVLIEPNGERTMLTDRGTNDGLAVSDIDQAALDAAEIVHVSGYTLLFDGPRAAGVHALRRAAEARKVTSVDPNSVAFLAQFGVGQFLELTKGLKLCFPNAEEACLLSGERDPVTAACRLNLWYETVVCKLGASGAVVAQHGRVVAQATAKRATVIDTTGAGDAFAGGYLSLLGGSETIESCLDRALTSAAIAVATVGGRPA